jgi:hypothetical protein
MNATLEDHLIGQFNRRVEATAQRLRDMADEIERHRDPRPGEATQAAAQITHTFIWGLANTNVDSVVSAAAESDRYLTPEGDRA